MVLTYRKTFLWKPFCLIYIVTFVAFATCVIKSIFLKNIKSNLSISHRSRNNIIITDSNHLATVNPKVESKDDHQRSFFTFNEMSSFIEKLPVNDDINCDTFLSTEASPNIPKAYFYQKQKVPETFQYKNCSILQNQGFKIPATEKELNHPIAFSISAFRDAQQVTRLIRAIYRPHNAYCIHIDIKSSPELAHNIRLLSSCLQNVFIAPIRLAVKSPTFNTLEPELLCMHILLRHRVRWKTWINLTGQEFPLKTNLELVSVLDLMNGVNDVKLDTCTHHRKGDDESAFHDCGSAINNGWMEKWPRNHGPPPYGIVPCRGSAHVILSRDFVRFLMTSDPARAFLRWLRSGMRVPEEFLFPSIACNLHLHASGSIRIHNTTGPQQSIARLKLSGRKQHKECLKNVNGICILSLQELPILMLSHKMFAGKFYQSFSPLGYSCLESWYFRKVYKEMTSGGEIGLDLDFYRHLYGKLVSI